MLLVPSQIDVTIAKGIVKYFGDDSIEEMFRQYDRTKDSTYIKETIETLLKVSRENKTAILAVLVC